MAKTDLTITQIESLLDKKLAPISKELKNLSSKVDVHSEILESHTASLVNIESYIKVVVDIWEFVKSHTDQLKDHEERITVIESSPKF